jgi:hypothetical protein
MPSCPQQFPDKESRPHRLLAAHLTAECGIKTEGRGRTVDEWKLRPERNDNHWFDGLVGCAVGASMEGVTLENVGGFVSQLRRERVSFAKMREGAISRRR